MDEEKRSLCHVKVSRDMVEITYERSGQKSLKAHATFDHQAALQLNTLPGKTHIQKYGQELYNLLLLADPQQNVSAVFKRCFDDPPACVQVCLEIVDETLAELLELSWEHLCTPAGLFLAIHQDFRFLRRLSRLGLKREPPLSNRPRVLVVVSSPQNLESGIEIAGKQHSFDIIEPPFHPEQTQALDNLFSNLKESSGIADYRILSTSFPNGRDDDLAYLKGFPTLDRIYQELEAAEYHIVHFLAHGHLDESRGGYLILTDESGNARPIHQSDFQALFPEGHRGRLIFFAACQSAGGEQKIGGPLAGLAPMLLELGIPAVIAMQDKITMGGAAVFTETFYQELAEHGYIDTAIWEARRGLKRVSQDREWFIPVLYLQNENPRLFNPAVDSPTSRKTIANPFYTSGRINDPNLFFGRQRIVREICTELKKKCSVSVIGGSQIGKSSLLYYLYKTCADWLPDVTVEYIDLQRVLDEADFCETVLSKLGESGDTLRDLKRALQTSEVILLLDEVERIAEPDFNPRLHDLLRSLAQEPHFAMCLATQHSLVEVFPARTPGGLSPFHNIFTRKELGPFTETEARDLIATRLANTGVTFTDREIERLLAESGCHPAKLQKKAKALFAEKTA